MSKSILESLSHCVPELPIYTSLFAAKLRYYNRMILRKENFHPFAIYETNPNNINRYVQWNRFRSFKNSGSVKSGSWDLEADRIRSHGKFILINEYFSEGSEPEELTHQQLTQHDYPPVEVESYTEYGYADYLDSIAESIRETGVWEELPDEHDEFPTRYDYVAINIGRNGELIFDEDGCHRLYLSKILDKRSIPVRVNVVHDSWYRKHGSPESHPQLRLLKTIDIPWRDVIHINSSGVTPAHKFED